MDDDIDYDEINLINDSMKINSIFKKIKRDKRKKYIEVNTKTLKYILSCDTNELENLNILVNNKINEFEIRVIYKK